jgi:hypothetical protein
MAVPRPPFSLGRKKLLTRIKQNQTKKNTWDLFPKRLVKTLS